VLLRNGGVNDELVVADEVLRGVPPVELAYHRNVPLELVDALSATVPGLQDIPLVPVTAFAVPRVAVTAILPLVQAGDVVEKVT
jgi:hypothetical protein